MGTGKRRRAAVFAAVAALSLAVVAGAAADDGIADGVGSEADPPLLPFASLNLAGPGGAVQAVVYEGNEVVITTSNTSTLTGFTVPAVPFTAKTTYVVADGQNAGDRLTFSGGAGTLAVGPDAFLGADGCSYGSINCLWDTRTFDVSAFTATGATSASVNVISDNDCLNHEAQVLAVGPTSAWAGAGYVAAGTGLRNQGSGRISIAGVPAGSTVKRALLYWNVLNPSNPGGAMTFNGAAAPGTLVKQGGDPCWAAGASWAYRADVTSQVSGDGTYTVSGFPTGTTSGLSPFASTGSPLPRMEGASLLVFYERSQSFKVNFTTFIPHDHVIGPIQSRCGFPPLQQIYFAGDSRGFDANATSYRARSLVGVIADESADADGLEDGSVQNLIGESKGYAPDALADGRIDAADDDAVLGDCHLLHSRGTASNSSMHVDVTRVGPKIARAHIYGGASNPLVLGAPAIDWDLTLTIDASASPTKWTLKGAHDGFPGFEVYVNGQTLYTYDPGPPPYNFIDHTRRLFPPLDVDVDRSGDLP